MSRDHLTLLHMSICFLLMGCGNPSQSQIETGYRKLAPLVELIDEHIALTGSAPKALEELTGIGSEPVASGLLGKVNYVQIEVEKPSAFKLWLYVHGRCSLWYVSFDEGGLPSGWYLDCETGQALQPVAFDSLPAEGGDDKF